MRSCRVRLTKAGPGIFVFHECGRAWIRVRWVEDQGEMDTQDQGETGGRGIG